MQLMRVYKTIFYQENIRRLTGQRQNIYIFSNIIINNLTKCYNFCLSPCESVVYF